MTFVSMPIPPGMPGEPNPGEPSVATPPEIGHTRVEPTAVQAPQVAQPPTAPPAASVGAGAVAGATHEGGTRPAPIPMIVPLPELTPELQARSAGPAAAPAPAAVAAPAAGTSRPARSPRQGDRSARSPVQRSRPAQAPGLTAPGVTVIVFAGSLVGMLLDVFTGGGLGWLFGVAFIASSAYAAFQVRRADRAAAIIAPPLVFAVLVMADKFIGSAGDIVAKSVGALNALLDYGPMLWIGSGLSVLIVGFTMWRERRPASTSGPGAAPGAGQREDAPPLS